MRIDIPPRRRPTESIIPMINVVFLLLIFFLMTAQIAPAPPLPITPPQGEADSPALDRDVLHVSADGDLAWNEARGEAVWTEIAARGDPGPVEIRADARTPAALIAAHLRRLHATSEGARLVVGKR